jgi:hypothetical protein
MQRKLKILVYVAGATLFLVGLTIAQERLAPVVAVQVTPTFSFGMIGVGTADSARLNVVNLVRTPPPIAIAQFPCKVELDLFDGQGKLIKQKTIANLGYGQADSIDLLRSEVATPGTHVEISGVVKVGSTQSFFCNISPTLEVFDSITGATSAILASAGSPLAFSAFPLNVRSDQP